jgi:DNA-directed RNA polymerase specialized sigma24 family protein
MISLQDNLAKINKRWKLFFSKNGIINSEQKMLIRANPSKYADIVPFSLIRETKIVDAQKDDFLQLADKFVKKIIKKTLRITGVSGKKLIEDFYSEGMVASIKAFYMYSKDSTKISTYLFKSIQRSIFRFIKYKTEIVRKANVVSIDQNKLTFILSKQEITSYSLDLSFLTNEERIVIQCKIDHDPYPSWIGSESTIMRLLRSAKIKILQKFSPKNARRRAENCSSGVNHEVIC